MVLVDSREPRHIDRFFKKKGWVVRRGKFADCGDIANDDLSIIFERKHRTDLIASIHDKRLFSQCDRIFNYCNRHDALGYLVITGDLVQSVIDYSNIIKKALRKQKKRLPRNWKLDIDIKQIYKYISMIPYHYDMNVLWYITEEEGLEAIHFMLQEIHVSDAFARTLNKRRRSTSKRRKKGVIPASRSKKREDAGAPKSEEDTYKYFVKLGLITDE